MSAVGHDEPTIRRIDDVLDKLGLAEANGPQTHRRPGAARDRRNDRSSAAGVEPGAFTTAGPALVWAFPSSAAATACQAQ